MVELVDTRDSKSRAREGLWVRIPPGVPARICFVAPCAPTTLDCGDGQQTRAPATARGSATGSSRDAAKVHERLSDVQQRLRRARAKERVLNEQVAYLGEVADDAETRKLVAQTPLADREWRVARTDLERHARLLEEARTEIEEFARERDRLLDRLLDAEGRRT